MANKQINKNQLLLKLLSKLTIQIVLYLTNLCHCLCIHKVLWMKTLLLIFICAEQGNHCTVTAITFEIRHQSTFWWRQLLAGLSLKTPYFNKSYKTFFSLLMIIGFISHSNHKFVSLRVHSVFCALLVQGKLYNLWRFLK